MWSAMRKTIWNLTEQQRRAYSAALERHLLTQQKLPGRCPDRRCRHWRTCCAPGLPCIGDAAAAPTPRRKQQKRAIRALRRCPPRL